LVEARYASRRHVRRGALGRAGASFVDSDAADRLSARFGTRDVAILGQSCGGRHETSNSRRDASIDVVDDRQRAAGELPHWHSTGRQTCDRSHINSAVHGYSQQVNTTGRNYGRNVTCAAEQ
jgi:hypothetical protein